MLPGLVKELPPSVLTQKWWQTVRGSETGNQGNRPGNSLPRTACHRKAERIKRPIFAWL